MAISKAISDFTGAVNEVRTALAEVDGKISELEFEQLRVTREPPHADDIIAMFQSGVKRVGQDFESKFRSYLTSKYTEHGSAGIVRPDSGLNILSIKVHEADRASEAIPGVISKNGRIDLDVMILTYFLRDKIAEEIPALVAKLCPQASKGMKSADRAAALREIDAKLAALRSEREALQAEIQAARAAVR